MREVSQNRKTGVVYSETVVHSAPEQYVAVAPYQIAIVDLFGGERATVQIVPEAGRVAIGDRVVFVQEQAGVAYYKKQS
jgi:uncharacterized OB-fold protein